jgi:hypothetical protein
MKKIIYNIIFLVVILFLALIILLSTIGIETNKFNKLISEKVFLTKSIDLNIKTIKFKIDPKKLNLFLETQNPEITYKEITLPVQNIIVFLDFLPLINSDLKIKKISLILNELNITEINKMSAVIKPSNFKSLLINKVKEGKVFSEIEIFLTEKGLIEDFIVKGSVKDLKVKFLDDLNFANANLSFFADKKDILIKNIYGELEKIIISDGDIKLNLDNGVKINSNFNSKIKYNEDLFLKYSKFLDKFEFSKNIKIFEANLRNNITIDLDETYKVTDYNYSISGKIEKSTFKLLNLIKSNFITEEIKEIYLSDLQIKTIFKPRNINFTGEGKYSLDDLNFLKIKLENNFSKDLTNLKLYFDYEKDIKLDLINYTKSKGSIANLFLDLEKNKNNIKINNFNFDEGNNSVKFKDLEFENNKFLSFKSIEVATGNNEFFIQNDKKIIIKGKKFDATNLSKYFIKKENGDNFSKLNSDIEIDFKNIKVPLSKKLKNYKLLGKIQNGEFVKISSKGDFEDNKFLDISMKKDENSDKKYLEIYSDLTKPFLTEYSFFNGLSGGKLFFTSIIEGSKSNSKLRIEKFKVVNAPGMIQLLSLADLRGLVDLAEGEGLSFDLLEINMEKDKNDLKLNEILALGPSISVLMEGYQDENGLTSLRGTLVPAKTLNNIISKIPVIGNIVIPKEVGEGLFGISFKMKGPKGNIKTSINPIRTLTPRFIQKIIERKRN